MKFMLDVMINDEINLKVLSQYNIRKVKLEFCQSAASIL